MEIKGLFKNQNLKQKVEKIKDVSFLNVFFKKFAIGLIVSMPLMVAIYLVSQHFVREWQETQIDNTLNRMALTFAEIEDTNIYEDQMASLANVVLSSYQETLEGNEFIVDSSLSYYNLTDETLIAKSFEIPVLCDDDAMSWWRKEADSGIGFPTISLSNEMMEFCKKHKDERLYIDKMVYINQVICPAKIVTLGSNGEEKDSCTAVVPSIAENNAYVGRAEIKLIGNEIGHKIYNAMTDYNFVDNDPSDDDVNNEFGVYENDETNSVEIVYLNGFDRLNAELNRKNFTINETDYQLDCAYQFSFWHGVWGIVLIVELLWVLLCAAIAFFTTKDVYNVFG